MKKKAVQQNENLIKLISLVKSSRCSRLFTKDNRIGPYNLPLLSDKFKLVIDLQKTYPLKATQKSKEFKRDNFMAGLGYKVIRFSSAQIYRRPETVIRTIEEAVAVYELTHHK